MPRHAIVAVLVLLVGCHSPTGPTPYLSGTITSRAARIYTVQLLQGTRTDSTPQMKVEAQPGTPLSPATCSTVAFFSLADVRSVRYASGIAADTSALTVGTQVRVWVTGLILTSCPPQAAADEIVIVSSGPLAAALRPNPRLQRPGVWGSWSCVAGQGS